PIQRSSSFREKRFATATGPAKTATNLVMKILSHTHPTRHHPWGPPSPTERGHCRASGIEGTGANSGDCVVLATVRPIVVRPAGQWPRFRERWLLHLEARAPSRSEPPEASCVSRPMLLPIETNQRHVHHAIASRQGRWASGETGE